jgi:mono/diheme cytochrome c family protein
VSPGTVTNLKIIGVVIATLGVYTWVANAIPQVESQVPEEVSFTADVSPEELASTGEELFDGAGGCTACHGLGTRAPNLREDHGGEGSIGERCGDRMEGMDCKAYLYDSMINPGNHLIDGFDNIMPPQDRILSSNQIWAIVAYLQSLGGEVTVTAEDIQGDGETGASASAGESAGESGGEGGGDASGAVAIMEQNACFGCHTLGDRGTELAPTFDDMGSRRDREYIRTSIVDPMADIAEGYENLAGTMPPNFGEVLSDEQLETVVDFLASQTDEGGGE